MEPTVGMGVGVALGVPMGEEWISLLKIMARLEPILIDINVFFNIYFQNNSEKLQKKS